MIKKTIGSFMAASALFVGLSGFNALAAQSTEASVEQEQSHSGWDKIIVQQSENIFKFGNKIQGTTGSAQSQSLGFSSFQLQSGKSSGSASASISEKIKFKLEDRNNGLSTVTEGEVTSNQSTETSGPATLIQGTNTSGAVFHFQGSIKGGPTIQNQLAQVHQVQLNITLPR